MLARISVFSLQERVGALLGTVPVLLPEKGRKILAANLICCVTSTLMGAAFGAAPQGFGKLHHPDTRNYYGGL